MAVDVPAAPPRPALLTLAMAVNDRLVELGIEPRNLLLDALRDRRGPTGVTRSCDVQVVEAAAHRVAAGATEGRS